VRLGADAEEHWIEVSDNGIGMSENIMTGPLLDFGTSFWNSEAMARELPGLASSGFDSTGKYGIGFFSLFMWGKHVRVTSRSYRDAPRDTRVLEFVKGLNTRPILRRALDDEQLTEAGTAVRIWVGPQPESEGGVLFDSHRKRKKLEKICEWLCPAIDAGLFVQRGSKARTIVVRASDWKTIDGERLLKRLTDEEDVSWIVKEQQALIPFLAQNLRIIKDSAGEVVGRVAVVPSEILSVYLHGAVTTGGLRACGIRHLAGVLEGVSSVASRNIATPIVEPSKLANWASEQATLQVPMRLSPSNLAAAASTIGQCGGVIENLPIAESSKGWLSPKDIVDWAGAFTEVIICDSRHSSDIPKEFGDFELTANVLFCSDEGSGYLNDYYSERQSRWPQSLSFNGRRIGTDSNRSVVVGLLAEAWATSVEEVLAVSDISQYPKYFYATIGKIAGKNIRRASSILRNPRVVAPSIKKKNRRRVSKQANF
jgi:hypothetical protein